MEFVKQLGKLGYNVVLVARNVDKMKQVASTLSTSTKIIQFDFDTTNDTLFNTTFESLKDLNIQVLVNNVGISHEHPINFVDESITKINSIININVNSMLKMSHLVVPGMIKNKQGLVLNIVN